MAILITGGAGFIGSHLTRFLVRKYPAKTFVNLDLLTYAGNPANLIDVKNEPNHRFVQGDICNAELLHALFDQYRFDGVFHLAAESHVDRSIGSPLTFVQTNVVGTATLLQVCLERWKDDFQGKRFLHVSTDEVFGSLGSEGHFQESTPYSPRSPYSAAKASADHFVRAYFHTYGMPIVISNCSNNYGPYQFPEKLIPVCILNALNNKKIPVYGQGDNVRDWLYVDDHVSALDTVFNNGRIGESYNVGGRTELRNLELVESICDLVDEERGAEAMSSRKLISFVTDRAGHDYRYAVDCGKIESELGWQPQTPFQTGLKATVRWYLDSQDWYQDIQSGRYRELCGMSTDGDSA